MKRTDLAFRERYDLHAGKAKVLEQRRDVFLITRQSIKRFGDHHVEAAAARVRQELLIAWTQMAPTRRRRRRTTMNEADSPLGSEWRRKCSHRRKTSSEHQRENLDRGSGPHLQGKDRGGGMDAGGDRHRRRAKSEAIPMTGAAAERPRVLGEFGYDVRRFQRWSRAGWSGGPNGAINALANQQVGAISSTRVRRSTEQIASHRLDGCTPHKARRARTIGTPMNVPNRPPMKVEEEIATARRMEKIDSTLPDTRGST